MQNFWEARGLIFATPAALIDRSTLVPPFLWGVVDRDHSTPPSGNPARSLRTTPNQNNPRIRPVSAPLENTQTGKAALTIHSFQGEWMSDSLPPPGRGGSSTRGAGLGGDALLPASTPPSLQAQYDSLRSIYGSSPPASRPAHTYTPAALTSRTPVLTMTAPLPSVHRAPATKQQPPSAPLTRTWSPSSSASNISHERLKRRGQEFESARLVTISFDGSLRQGTTTRGRGGDSAIRAITSSRGASLVRVPCVL